jgi:hypothetical protein
VPVYNEFVDLISDRNPGRRGRYWEIGPGGKARLRPDAALDVQGRREAALVERLRTRAREGKPLWRSQAIVGRVTLSGIARDYPSPWAGAGGRNWIFDDARLFDEPVAGIRGRAGIFEVELPDDQA